MSSASSATRCGWLRFLAGMLLVLAVAGCSYKPAYLRGAKTDIPQRWTVQKIDPARLSEDQRATLDRRGPPTYVRFFREVDSREAVYAWIYAAEGEPVEVVWFVGGTRAEEIAVDRDPSAFSSTTRRRSRMALLVGTGAAVLPAIVFLANR
jgi:hypothetical protein